MISIIELEGYLIRPAFAHPILHFSVMFLLGFKLNSSCTMHICYDVPGPL